MVFISLQDFSLGLADAHVGGIRGIRDSFGGETLVSSRLLHGGDHEGLQHSGSILRGGERHSGIQVSARIQPAAEKLQLLGAVCIRRCVESIFFEALESGSSGLAEGDLRTGRHIAGYSAREPGNGCLELSGLPRFHHRRIGGIDFQPVGLDGLDMQGLVETAAANLQIGIPVSRGIIRLGGDVETEESVGALAGRLGIELPRRSEDFQRGGVVCREGPAAVCDQRRDVQGIPRTPHSPLAIDKGLDALLEHLTADVETADGAFVAACDFQICRATAGLGDNGERFAVHI